MPEHIPRTRRSIRVPMTLGVFAVLLFATPTAAQLPSAHRAEAPRQAVVLIVRDASSGHPLDAAQVVRTVRGGTPAVIGRSDASGRITLPMTQLTIDGDAAVISLVVQRIGYAPNGFTAEDLLQHLAEHDAPTHDILLTPRPVMLSTITTETTVPNQLAAGTALAVTSADRAIVAEQGATSLAESLAGVEGVTTSRTGAWGSKIAVRGLGGERLAYMVDGSRVNRACTFGMDQGLATVDPASVERVEILAGPGSTLYGSGNVGGVVNVVTRNPALSLADGEVGGELRVGASSSVPGGTAGFGVWTRRDRLDLALQVDAQRYGDYRTPLGTVAGSSYRGGTADFKAGYALTSAQRLAFQYTEYAARDIGWPSMGGGSIPSEGRRALALDWAWQRGGDLLDAVSVRTYVQRLDHHMLMDMVMPMSGGMGGSDAMHDGGMGGDAMTMRSTTDARSYSTTSGGRAQIRLRPDHRTHIDAGIEAIEWSAEGTRWVTTRHGNHTPDEVAYHTWPGVRIVDLGVFAQGEREVANRLTVSAGARADRITKRASGWQPANQAVGTGNIGARLSLGAGFGIRSSAGVGYRVPDPTELFGTVARPDGYVYRGNPELSTETGRTVEAGLAWDGAVHRLAIHDASIGITVFRNNLTGMISPSLVTGDSLGGLPIREYVNVADARLQGATAALRAHVGPALRVSGSATMVRGEQLANGSPLAGVAPVTGSVALRLEPDVTSGFLHRMASVMGWLELEGRAAARQHRAAHAAGEVVTPGWGVLTLRGGATVGGMTLGASVDNLLDHTYREHMDPVALLRPGRNFSVRVTRSF